MTDRRITVITPRRQLPRPSDGILRRSFRVGGYTVTLTHDLACTPGATGQVNVQWSPRMPRKLTAAQFERYRRLRNETYQEFSDIIGGSIVVADI